MCRTIPPLVVARTYQYFTAEQNEPGAFISNPWEMGLYQSPHQLRPGPGQKFLAICQHRHLPLAIGRERPEQRVIQIAKADKKTL